MLAHVLEKDRAHGYTQYGPHRADFKLLLDGHGVATHCSRGQQKAVTVGFMLAQVMLQQQQGAAMGAFLLDDLTSELDAAHQQRVLEILRELDTQVFVSAIQGESIHHSALQGARRFHVEHGTIQEVV
jgi:DNA replication and repair protein RecF